MPHPPRTLTHDGLTLTLGEWSARTGLPVNTIRARLDLLGWDAARALSTPADRRFRRGGRRSLAADRPCPPLREHKGQARVRWRAGGREHTRGFGAWGSAEARAAYRRFAAEWAAGPAAGGGSAPSLAAVLAGWLAWCEGEYRKGGRWTSEVYVCRAAAAVANDLYGDRPAAGFGPAQLRAVRQVLLGRNLSRRTVNGYCGRLCRALGWAAGQSLVPAATAAALREVERVKPGRVPGAERVRKSDAKPAAVAAAVAALPDTPRGRLVRAAVEVQRLTGMRPGEVCHLRPADLDRTGSPWSYRVRAPKGLHRGESRRVYYLGPRAQAVLAPLLDGCPAAAPALSYALSTGRRVGLSPCGYGRAVRSACRAAGCEPWTPHQLRHALATEVAARYGSVETAAHVIGDTVATAARVYVHVDPRDQARRDVAAEMG